MAEIRGRYGEIWGRYSGDIGEMWGRYRGEYAMEQSCAVGCPVVRVRLSIGAGPNPNPNPNPNSNPNPSPNPSPSPNLNPSPSPNQVGCPKDWVGDGYCDEACYNQDCRCKG